MHLYTLAKGVEGGRGERILYIVDSILIKLPYPLLYFLKTRVTINVMWLFLTVPWVGLQFVIVVFPDHTHLLLVRIEAELTFLQDVLLVVTVNMKPCRYIFWIYFNIVDLCGFLPYKRMYPHKSGTKINFDILTIQEDHL